MWVGPSPDSSKCVSLYPAASSGSPGDTHWGALICRRTGLGAQPSGPEALGAGWMEFQEHVGERPSKGQLRL